MGMALGRRRPEPAAREAKSPRPELPAEWGGPGAAVARAVSLATWNVAAVNNNPFEYWISVDDGPYNRLMQGVERFLAEPGEYDVPVSHVFTEAMFAELMELMTAEGWPGLDAVESYFREHIAGRKVVTEFVKDKELGAKRLISMPDRVTNTINVVSHSETSRHRPPPMCRPSVINSYEGDLSTVSAWWSQWKVFMFHTPLTVKVKSGSARKRAVEMLESIPKAKYPAVSDEEERISIPLQVVCQAVFDAIIVHFMNLLSPEGDWEDVKSRLCERLCRQKNHQTISILANKYGKVDAIALQEVAAVFADLVRGDECSLGQSHFLVLPEKLDGKRDQNSLLLLARSRFVSAVEVTSQVEAHIVDVKLADGDLLVASCTDTHEDRYLIVSFHGDTSGLLSVPVIRAIRRAHEESFRDHVLLMGLDTNVCEENLPGRTSWGALVDAYTDLGLTSCWGDRPDPSGCRTTCNARTSLQPQLNKAIRFVEKEEKADKNPKDIILFAKDQLSVSRADGMGHPNPLKDNTGNLYYKERSIFPTLDFPSDHGILVVALQPVRSVQGDLRIEDC